MRAQSRPLAGAVLLAGLLVGLALGPARAAAHPGPGYPPEFAIGNCITVVDQGSTPSMQLPYTVLADDVTFGEGEIQLPDSKTHQFFAFRGAVVTVALSNAYQLFPFDPAIEQALPMAMWLDQDDVERAAGAAGPVDMTGFTAAMVLPDSVLSARAELRPYLLPFADKTSRVPITVQQANMGASWDLRSLAPGVYAVGGYVFSPPFNDWAMRAGVVKVVDGQTAVPAAVVEPIDAFLYAGQGRKIGGCVDAPAGSKLRTWIRAEDMPDQPWEPWLDDQPVDGDRFELCLQNALPGRAGLLRVRVQVTAPDGQSSVAYSPDTVLAVATQAACVESAKTCCPPAMTPPDAGVSDAGMPVGGDGGASGSAAGTGGAPVAGMTAAGTGAAPGSAAGNGAAGASGPMPQAGTAADPTPAEDEHHDDDGGGCAVRAGQHGRSLGAASWLAVCWGLVFALSRVRAARRRGKARTAALRSLPSDELVVTSIAAARAVRAGRRMQQPQL